MLRNIKNFHIEIATELYNLYGNKPFTSQDYHKKIGERKLIGYTAVSMKWYKCIKEIDREYFSKDGKTITTYRLTKDMIDYLKLKGYVDNGV